MADRFGPVCPQKLPDIRNETESLKKMPAGRLKYLKRLLPMLTNHSEDCLYLNIYVPARTDLSSSRLAVMVFIHGESFEWNSGNPYDGSVLASYGNVLVVTVNYRLGAFGFLPIVDTTSRGNYGLMDQVAALHWIQENIAEFGGDPRNVTIVGHGHGAACVHLLMLSPMVKNLFQRVILHSGSALSPWAIARSAKRYARELSETLGCPVHDNTVFLACMRNLDFRKILAVQLTVPDHLTVFGPTIDGIVVPKDPIKMMEDEESLFIKYDLMFGVNKVESFFGFTGEEDKHGIDTERRDRLIRTLIRNTRRYHLQEIFLTVINEYTDWTKPVPSPSSVMDTACDAMGDSTVVAPLVRVGNYHALAKNQTTYFYVFGHQTEFGYYNTRSGSLHGEELPYVFGIPHLSFVVGNLGNVGRNGKFNANNPGGKPQLENAESSCPLSVCQGFGHLAQNYTKQESILSEQVMIFWTSFAKTGDPTGLQPEVEPATDDKGKGRSDKVLWPPYDSVHQKYMLVGIKSKLKDHYNAHRLSFWLHLVPNLDQSRGIAGDLHHHQLEDHDNQSSYDGVIRSGTPGAMDDPYPDNGPTTESAVAIAPTKSHTDRHGSGSHSSSGPSELPKPTPESHEATAPIPTTNVTNSMAVVLPPNGYSTALSVTIAVGCSLLILNVLIFAGVYYQRDKKGEEGQRKSPKMMQGSSQAESHFGPVHPSKHQFIRLPTSGGHLSMPQAQHHHHHIHDHSPDFGEVGLVPSVIGILPPKVPPKPSNMMTSPHDHLNMQPEAQPLLSSSLVCDPGQMGVQVLPIGQHHQQQQQQQQQPGSNTATLGRGTNRSSTAQEMRVY